MTLWGMPVWFYVLYFVLTPPVTYLIVMHFRVKKGGVRGRCSVTLAYISNLVQSFGTTFGMIWGVEFKHPFLAALFVVGSIVVASQIDFLSERVKEPQAADSMT